MTTSASFNVKGFAELQAELKGLERKIFRKVVGKSVRDGAKVIQKAAKDNAPVRSNSWEGANYPNPPGTLKKGIKIERAKKQPSNIIRDRIGFSQKAWYGRLVELGHRLVRGDKTIGQVSPRPFLRPAFDANVEKAIDAMQKTMAEEMDKLK